MNQKTSNIMSHIFAILNSDLIKILFTVVVTGLGTWYNIRSDLRSLTEGQEAFKGQLKTIIDNQHVRDSLQDERIASIGRESSENSREIRQEIRDLRQDFRAKK